ncbi:MAG: site-specific integrase [Bacteroidota bacterium]
MSTFTLNFYIKREKVRKDGTVPLYARITINGKRAEFSLKRNLLPEHWNTQKGAPQKRKGKERELIAYLESVRSKIYQEHRKLIDKGEFISAQNVKMAFHGESPTQKYTLIRSYEYQVKRMEALVGKTYAPRTIVRYKTGLKHLKNYLFFYYNREDISLSELKLRFIADFDHYLRTEKDLGNNATVKYAYMVMKAVKLAVKNDWLEKDPFVNYSGKQIIEDREFLDSEELLAIESHPFAIKRLDMIRDVFIFSCYTGLAYVDVANLNEEHIFRDVHGDYWININRVKTSSKSMIPLLPKALEILEKYQDIPEKEILGKLLPVKSNQKTNAYLKEIATICGIKKKLTFHIARHTFATTITLSNGVPIESVSSMLGHKDLKTTQHYAKIVQSKVGHDMRELRERLSGSQKSTSKVENLRKLG